MQLMLIRLWLWVLGLLSPRALGRTVFRLFTTPLARAPLRDRDSPLMEQATKVVLCSGGDKIHVYQWAAQSDDEAPAPARVLILHGFQSAASRMSTLVARTLEAGFEVITFDAPAHGESTGKRLMPAQYVAAVHAVAQHFGGVDALVGHSFGGLVAAVSVSGSSVTGIADLPACPLVLLASPNAASVPLQGANELLRVPTRLQPRVFEAFTEAMGYTPQEVSLAMMMREYDSPVLIVHDTRDEVVPATEAQAYAAVLSDVDLYLTTGLGHHRLTRNPHVADYVSEFLTRELSV